MLSKLVISQSILFLDVIDTEDFSIDSKLWYYFFYHSWFFPRYLFKILSDLKKIVAPIYCRQFMMLSILNVKVSDYNSKFGSFFPPIQIYLKCGLFINPYKLSYN